MSKYFLILLSISTLFLFGCKKPPVACIELSETSVSAGVAITFTSCSKKSLSYEWFISGPTTAPENSLGWSDESFSRAFTVPGTYTVKLSAYEDFSFSGEVSIIEETFVIN